ncbi:MAG: hypothetical protein Ct9H90mP13_04940 [Pseudomonadota bacterium]|nr:MAG: hypothetical protein Ct9H90mP13_04940 [Pseudomonadota bacterium]
MILGMGGYASPEICRAGGESMVIIQEQNSIAGRVNRFLIFFRKATLNTRFARFFWVN